MPTIDATGRCVLPGLVECHSHPLFAGERHHEYAERLGGASLAEVAARGGGIWSSVVATRNAGDDELLHRLATTLRTDHRRRRDDARGEVRLRADGGEELRGLELLQQARSLTPMQLAITFLGAHVVPRDLEGDADERADQYTELIDGEMLPAVVSQGIAEFQDVTVEQGYFTPEQGSAPDATQPRAGAADARPCRCVGAVAGLADRGRGRRDLGRAPHLHAGRRDPRGRPYRHRCRDPADGRARVHDERQGECPAVHRHRRARGRCDRLLLVDSRHVAANTVATAAPWFRMTPGEVIVGATLNAAYSLGRQASCGSLDVGKRGDLHHPRLSRIPTRCASRSVRRCSTRS